MARRSRAPIAVTCGDPSGIGPEIAVAAWSQLREEYPIIWVGDPRHLPDGTPYKVLDNSDDPQLISSQCLPVHPIEFAALASPGRPEPGNASGVIAAIERAVELTKSSKVGGLCTAPISKYELVTHAVFQFPGHTEFLEHLGGASRAVMMLASDELRVVPATIHIPLKDVPNALSSVLLEETIQIVHAAIKTDFGIVDPKIAVAGLNPHAGENGMLGSEDGDIILPVCDRLRDQGMSLMGPLPADTMFHAAARKNYDVAIAMYHDQALIPIKTLAFDKGVNVTLGLPFVRTSPDHGTAFDIAGKGVADPTSMIEAIKLASQMAERRNS